MKRISNKIYTLFFYILGILFIILILYLLHEFSGNQIVFPSISSIFNRFFLFLGDKKTYLAIFYTILRTFIGLLVAGLLGYFIGLFAGLYSKIEFFLKPLISILKSTPVPCFIFILFVFFPFNKTLATTIVVFMIVFPIIYESAKEGVKNIDKDIILSLRLDGLKSFHSINSVIMPLTLPYVVLSFLTSFGLAIKVEITSEILINSIDFIGLGELIYLAYSNNEFYSLFALIIIILIIFAFFDTIIYLFKKTFIKK